MRRAVKGRGIVLGNGHAQGLKKLDRVFQITGDHLVDNVRSFWTLQRLYLLERGGIQKPGALGVFGGGHASVHGRWRCDRGSCRCF